MPKVTTSGGASNAWEQTDAPPVRDDAAEVPVAEPAPETAPEPEAEQQADEAADAEVPLQAGDPVSSDTAPAVEDGPAPVTLPPGWTPDPGPDAPDDTETQPDPEAEAGAQPAPDDDPATAEHGDGA